MDHNGRPGPRLACREVIFEGGRVRLVSILTTRSDESGTMLEKFAEKGLRAIVLDAVGTLIDADPSVSAVYAEVARRQGVVIDAATIRTRFPGAFHAVFQVSTPDGLATDEATEKRCWRKVVSEVLREVPDSARAFEELWDHFAQPESWRTFPDVRPVMEAIQAAGLMVRIGSNFDARLRPVIAGLPDLEALRDSLVISSEVGRRKPHELFYKAACADLGVAASQVLFVGDDIENDLEGPQRAGLKALLINRGPQGMGLRALLTTC